MRDKKVYIVLLICIFVFFVVMFLVFGLQNIKKGNTATTILVGDSSVWTFQNQSWMNLRDTTSIQSYNWQEFQVYVDNQSLGNYYVWHDDKWYLFDADKNAIPYEGELLAYQGNYPITIASFELEDIVDRTYVDAVLSENGISLSSEFTSFYQISFDMDQDGVEEEFYLVSNVFSMDYVPDSVFSFVFMVKEGKVSMIYQKVDQGQYFNGCKPFVTSFLDVDQDHSYELLLSCGRYSISKQVDMLYKYENGAFKMLISNQ